jgi:hypothetical protein
MKSLCDACLIYGPIFGVLEVEQHYADKTKHLCADCYFGHKKQEEISRQKRREQRERRSGGR